MGCGENGMGSGHGGVDIGDTVTQRDSDTVLGQC